MQYNRKLMIVNRDHTQTDDTSPVPIFHAEDWQTAIRRLAAGTSLYPAVKAADRKNVVLIIDSVRPGGYQFLVGQELAIEAGCDYFWLDENLVTYEEIQLIHVCIPVRL